MSLLHVMFAVNIVLVMIVAALCVKYDIPRKIIRRLSGRGIDDGVIDPVTTEPYARRTDIFRREIECPGVIVMLGDSLTETTPLCEFIGFHHKLMNRGISSDNTRGVLHRLDEVLRLKATKIFILLGINDIGNGFTLDESMKNYREIIMSIKRDSPSTEIYAQSIFPVDHKKLPDNARCRRRTSAAITTFNEALHKLANETGCIFVDTYSVFADEAGEMDGGCTFDGLHLNGAGMMRWLQFVEKYM